MSDQLKVTIECNKLSPVSQVIEKRNGPIWVIACVSLPWIKGYGSELAWFFVEGAKIAPAFKGFHAYRDFIEAYGPYKSLDEARQALEESFKLTAEGGV